MENNKIYTVDELKTEIYNHIDSEVDKIGRRIREKRKKSTLITS